MVSLDDIQNKVKQAQEEIKERKFDHVNHVLWPEIKTALGQRVDLVRPVRSNMGFIIHKSLDEQDLHGGAYTDINVEQLRAGLQADLQAGRLQELKPPQTVTWLPY